MAAEDSKSEDTWFNFAPLTPELLASVQELDSDSYPADEAASPQGLKFRSEVAGSFFYVATTQEGALVGFVCGTTTDKQALGKNIAYYSFFLLGGTCTALACCAQMRIACLHTSQAAKCCAFTL